MSESPLRPKLLKAGIVILNRDNGNVENVISLQYNPDSLTRNLTMQGASEGSDRLEALRLTGPPVETLTIEATLDATDQLEFPDNNPVPVQVGVAHQLAAFEKLLYPELNDLAEQHQQAAMGSIEIMPAVTSLPVFVWGKNRILPVRITDFSVNEESFDIELNPIRAKISMGMRVLTINDLPYDSIGGGLYRVYQRGKEQLASQLTSSTKAALGIVGTL